MAVRILGNQRELHPKHQFIVEIDGVSSTGFSKMSELSQEHAKIEYWEGGSIIPWKVPGRTTMSDVTLEHGASSDQDFYLWAQSVTNAAAGSFPTRGAGDNTPTYMRNLDIIQLDRDGTTALRSWRLHNAWVQKFVAGEWDNNTDEVVIEMLTLTYDYFTLFQT